MNILCYGSSSSQLWDVGWPEFACSDLNPHTDFNVGLFMTLNRPTLIPPSHNDAVLQTTWSVTRMCHLWMLFYSFVLSVPHCRSIQIVCSACYTWCYKITNTEVRNLAVQYSMYLNVCCAININVYNIFYNTGEADLIVWYELTKWTYREKCSLRNVIVIEICTFVLIYIRKALKGFTVKSCAMYINGQYTLRRRKNSIILIDVKFTTSIS